MTKKNIVICIIILYLLQEKLKKKIGFVLDFRSGTRPRSNFPGSGSADPDQNEVDPQHSCQ